MYLGLNLSICLSRDGKVMQLVEKDLQSKLELLFKKNFYDVAIKVARHQNLDKVQTQKIHN